MRVLARPLAVDPDKHVRSAHGLVLGTRVQARPPTRSSSDHSLGSGMRVLARPPAVDPDKHVLARLIVSSPARAFTLGHPQSTQTSTSSLGSQSRPRHARSRSTTHSRPDKRGVLARLTVSALACAFSIGHLQSTQTSAAFSLGSRSRPRHARSRSATRSRPRQARRSRGSLP